MARIAVTGATGLGKTTLVRALAQHFQLPIIEERWEPISEALHAWKAAKNRPAPVVARARARYIQAGIDWLRFRGGKAAEHGQFIADRMSVDLLVSWMFTGIDQSDPPAFHTVFRDAVAQANSLDLIVVPKYGDPLAVGPNETGQLRDVTARRLLAHGLTRGLLAELVTTPVLYLPAEVASTPQRVAYIQSWLLQRISEGETPPPQAPSPGRLAVGFEDMSSGMASRTGVGHFSPTQGD